MRIPPANFSLETTDAGLSVKGSVQENVMFAPKDLRPSEIMALRTLIGGRTGNMPQTLGGIIVQVSPVMAGIGDGIYSGWSAVNS